MRRAVALGQRRGLVGCQRVHATALVDPIADMSALCHAPCGMPTVPGIIRGVTLASIRISPAGLLTASMSPLAIPRGAASAGLIHMLARNLLKLRNESVGAVHAALVMEASAIQRILIGRGAITLEARSEHRDGIDMLVFGELPRIIQAGKCLGVNLNLARRRGQWVAFGIVAEIFQSDDGIELHLINTLFTNSSHVRHFGMSLAALLIEILNPVVMRTAFGKLIFLPNLSAMSAHTS